MKPNFRWKKSTLYADSAVTSNEDLHTATILPCDGDEFATNSIVTKGGSPRHVAALLTRDPESEGRKPKCLCSSQVIKTRTRQDNSLCKLKNILCNWRPDWRGSFVFVVILVCLLSRTTLGAVSSDSSTTDGDDHLLFNARRLSSLTVSDSTNFLQEENSATHGTAGSEVKDEHVPCGKNKGVHVKIQYSSSIVENGNVFHLLSIAST